MEETRRPASIYLFYDRSDERYARELRNHLSPLRHEGLLDFLDMQSLRSGQAFAESNYNLDQADIIVPLISSDLLASKYPELERTLERHARGEVSGKCSDLTQGV